MWTDAEAAALARQLAVDRSRRFKQRSFPSSPKGRVAEQLQDYRGCPLGQVVNFDIVDADLSGAHSTMNEHGAEQPIVLTSCRCRRVRFDRAGKFHMLHGVFDRCSFDAIRTDRCGMTGLYRDCTFVKANLRRAVLAGDFVRCVFDEANLLVDSLVASFTDCVFRHCRLSPLFGEGRDVLAGGPVSFSVLVGGSVKPGHAVQFANMAGLLHGWEDGGA